jgi:hypothetical protein
MCAQAQVLRVAVGIYNLVRIHLALRIPQGFEFAESAHQLVSEHFRQKNRARLTIAVLARKRAAICHH